LGDLRDPSAIFLLLDLDSEGQDRRRSTKGDENSNLFIPRLTKISFSIRRNSKDFVSSLSKRPCLIRQLPDGQGVFVFAVDRLLRRAMLIGAPQAHYS